MIFPCHSFKNIVILILEKKQQNFLILVLLREAESMIKKLWELYVTFLRVGGLTFGGGMAMLPMLKQEVIEKKGWTTEEELLDIYAIGQCTPGIIAVNTSTYIGYEQAGILGAISSTISENSGDNTAKISVLESKARGSCSSVTCNLQPPAVSRRRKSRNPNCPSRVSPHSARFRSSWMMVRPAGIRVARQA